MNLLSFTVMLHGWYTKCNYKYLFIIIIIIIIIIIKGDIKCTEGNINLWVVSYLFW
jgi:hypothetical protein